MKQLNSNNLIDLFSEARLSSYKYNDVDNNVDNNVALERYLYNIEVSEAFYPLLAILEVVLRNRLDKALENIKLNWLLQELTQQDILLNGEYKKLQDTKSKLLSNHKTLTKEHLLADLSLGFWINLCSKKYKARLWHTKNFFRTVFADYPNFTEFDKLSKVFPMLQLFLKLRNRIFHHEIIINNPAGIKNCYNTLLLLLQYISIDSVDYLNKINRFDEIIAKQKP